ncbi:hypothetical protein CCHR01_17571 [Colletotrichum chrysophilum]|uniref:Uncharacterized protein n=1 Tax=Colletotrichum chrysophilum TaxID=1836956 RepID=A0AAD9E9R4_9PEZI|nr:hypothetical protein CCHR01_17571 [Colletotrichum chrysophilum]
MRLFAKTRQQVLAKSDDWNGSIISRLPRRSNKLMLCDEAAYSRYSQHSTAPNPAKFNQNQLPPLKDVLNDMFDQNRLLPLGPISPVNDSNYREGVLQPSSPDISGEFSAISAASSFALFKFFPSYQNRADSVRPWTVTRLDQAVRPPARVRTTHDDLEMTYLAGRRRSGRRAEGCWPLGRHLETVQTSP